MSEPVKRDLSQDQHRYLERLTEKLSGILTSVSESGFVENPEPGMLCQWAAEIFDSSDWCLVSVWLSNEGEPLSEQQTPRLVAYSEGFPQGQETIKKLAEEIDIPESSVTDAGKNGPILLGSNALLELGVGSESKRVWRVGFQQTVCNKKFRYTLAIAGRRQAPLETAPHTLFLSYDEYAVTPLLAVCLTFLKTRVEVEHNNFHRAFERRAWSIAADTGAKLFDLKDRWGIPNSSDAVKKYLQAYLVLAAEPREIHQREWHQELTTMRDVYIGKCADYETQKKDLEELLTRIVMTCLIVSIRGSFADRVRWVGEFVKGAKPGWLA